MQSSEATENRLDGTLAAAEFHEARPSLVNGHRNGAPGRAAGFVRARLFLTTVPIS